jgi:hypothetical protein
MRINLLEKREAFSDIFCRTIAAWLRQRFAWDGKVIWHADVGAAPSGPGCLLCNTYLNIIYPQGISPDHLWPLVREFAFHPVWWRRLAQGGYCRMATRWPLAHLFAHAVVEINPFPSDLAYIVFIPGNHAIRAIDLRKDECIVMVKDGFPSVFLENEISIRERFPWLPSPTLLESGPTRNWYREARITGLPLNRLPSQAYRNTILRNTELTLGKLYHHTIREIPLLEHLEEIRLEWHGLQNAFNTVVGPTISDHVTSLMEKLWENIRLSRSGVIPIVLSHGDLQPGNILATDCTDGGFFLIDWEYSRYRSLWYDLFVFHLQARFPGGLTERVRLLLHDQTSLTEPIIRIGGNIDMLPDLPTQLAIFLVEDLANRVREHAESPIQKAGPGMETLLLEHEGVIALLGEFTPLPCS